MYYSDRKQTDSRGRQLVDVKLLVLGALRYVATGCTFDALDELICVAGETHRVLDALKYHSHRDDLVEHYRIMCKHRLLSLCR